MKGVSFLNHICLPLASEKFIFANDAFQHTDSKHISVVIRAAQPKLNDGVKYFFPIIMTNDFLPNLLLTFDR